MFWLGTGKSIVLLVLVCSLFHLSIHLILLSYAADIDISSSKKSY